ncbi:MAG: protein phosphatase 2C domain-containing protein [Chloroflexi bacterium]|nr:protein phosphatase 2C domain-containing protein [Chloroflexota bacterium]
MTGHKAGWHVTGRSVRGYSHIRAGLPNQDAIHWLPQCAEGLPIILAISDGHGSAENVRSDTGACLAVKAAEAAYGVLLKGQAEESRLSTIKRWANEGLPHEILRSWRDAVAKDVVARPFTGVELDQVEAKKGANARSQVVLDPVLAYGATLLTVLVTESFVIYTQIGDGDILTVSETGDVTRPLPRDERLFANETTSLCSRDAWRDFHIGFQVLCGSSPALILLSTDGYSTSFRDEESFLKVGTDILELIRSDGLDKVNASLEPWLAEASRLGSGDDITLGIVCNIDAIMMSTEDTPVVHP